MENRDSDLTWRFKFQYSIIELNKISQAQGAAAPSGDHVCGGDNVHLQRGSSAEETTRLQRGSKLSKHLVYGEFRSRLVYKLDDLINQYMWD